MASSTPRPSATASARDVDAAYTRAVENGTVGVCEPQSKPWGQKVGYVKELLTLYTAEQEDDYRADTERSFFRARTRSVGWYRRRGRPRVPVDGRSFLMGILLVIVMFSILEE